MNLSSPFTLHRFEYEAKHRYFLPKEMFARIEQPKPTYLIGSRGTGKTTLLKALNWRERSENEGLMRQLKRFRSPHQFVGVYLKLPEIQLEQLSRWLHSEEEVTKASVFGFYLDLVWIEALLDAISELITNETFRVTATEEQRVVSEILDGNGQFASCSSLKISTLRELGAAVVQIRGAIEMSAALRQDVSEVVSKHRIVGQVGVFGRSLSEKLVQLCNSSSNRTGADKSSFFKICLDEGECLDEFQQRVVNTLLRLSKHPTFFVVSYVSQPADITSTVVRNLTLQQADRELIPLDDMTEKQFRELVEGVSTIRVQDILENSDARFDVRRVYGSLSINAVLEDQLKESVAETAKELLRKAEELSRTAFWKEVRASEEESVSASTGTRRNANVLPIYQAYLVDKLHISLPHPSKPGWAKRKQESAELRKRFVAAYLSICHEIHTDVRYSGAEMVLQMSDQCIRDFLHQTDEVFRQSGQALEDFLSVGATPIAQDRALKKASDSKYHSIPKAGVTSPNEVGSVIRGLGKLTTLVQSKSKNLEHLRSSERGLFVLPSGQTESLVGQDLIRLLREAAEAGFLRIYDSPDRTLKFRVHTSLAAAYGFSYRGAYYPVLLEWADLQELRHAVSEITVDEIAKGINRRIESGGSSLPLFEESDRA